jgi:hypothetical protein
MGAMGGGVAQQSQEDHVGGGGHRFDDPTGVNHQVQGQIRQGTGCEFHQFKGKQKDESVEKHQVYPANPIELRNRLNLAKEKKVVGDKQEDEARKLNCFRCQEVGHHQKNYTNAPDKCKEEGYMAAECVGFHSKAGELKMFDFAVPAQGYYIILIPRVGEVV